MAPFGLLKLLAFLSDGFIIYRFHSLASSISPLLPGKNQGLENGGGRSLKKGFHRHVTLENYQQRPLI